MKHCLLCNCETQGSTGAAGIKWSMICQECKDKEDKALETRVISQAKVVDLFLESL